jgi:hypothetical protein
MYDELLAKKIAVFKPLRFASRHDGIRGYLKMGIE